MSEDGAKDPFVNRVEQIVKQIDFRLALEIGEELRHIRSVDIAPERKAALAEIGKKANQEGIYPEGVFTHGDYYTMLSSVWDLVPQAKERKPYYMASAETFSSYMTRDEKSSPDTPLSSEWGDEVMAWRFKVHVSRDRARGGRKIALSTASDDSIIKAIGNEAWKKLTEAGLPLVDNRWLFE